MCLTAVAGDLEKRLNHGITGREISIDSLHLSEATLDNGDAEYSSSVKRPGLFRISSGMAILPMSCKLEAIVITSRRSATKRPCA